MSNLDNLLKDFNKTYGESIAFEGLERKEFERIPFTSPRANYCLYGGIPRNCFTEFTGEEGSGKTTSALDIIKNAQEIFNKEGNGKRIVYIDVENTLDEHWASLMGVNTKELVMIRPQTQTTENILDMFIELIKTGEVGLIILDSIAAMVPKNIYEKSLEEKSYGGNAIPLTRFINTAVPLLRKYDCTGLLINQVRQDLNNPYNQYITTGGQALKHGLAVRLMFKKDDFFDKSFNKVNKSYENPYGHLVRISVLKTKICRPDRKLSYYSLVYCKGVAWENDLIGCALSLGIVIQKGSYFSVQDDNGEVIAKYQGIKKLETVLNENIELKDYILDKVNKMIKD